MDRQDDELVPCECLKGGKMIKLGDKVFVTDRGPDRRGTVARVISGLVNVRGPCFCFTVDCRLLIASILRASV